MRRFPSLLGRRGLALALVLLGAVACDVGGAVLRELARPPSRQWVEENLSGEVLAYEVWDGTPHLVFWFGEDEGYDGKLYFDHLRRDLVSIDWPPTPRWQWTGSWYYVAATNAPASLGVARCTGVGGEACDKPTEVFGQVNAPEIVALEVEYGGAWRRFPVAAPGFAVRLDGYRGVPTAYRWLDRDGRAVWTSAQDPSRSWPQPVDVAGRKGKG
ncbi:MAG: hypothetical protein M3Q10_06070 [Chloroflexota bacterium]|nr:hypothetical protein [Chloroflexota bacterium]